jgi:hypothetical protein
MKKINLATLIILIFFLQSGCTSLQTFPVAARAGDTVSVALGSYDNMNTSNISVEFLPTGASPGGGISLTPRSVFRLYVDNTSRAVQNPTLFLGNVIRSSGHAPWLNVLVVDLPSILNTGLTPIDGQLLVTRKNGPGTSPIYPGHGTDLPDFWDDPAISGGGEDKIRIALTVLPTGLTETGNGSPTVFQYELGGDLATPGIVQTGNLPALAPLPHAVIAPPFDGDQPTAYSDITFGAVEMKLTLSAETLSGSPVNLDPATHNNLIRVFADDMEAFTDSRRSVVYRLTGTNELTVMFISPEGKLKYYEPRLSILFTPLSNLQFSSAPSVNSVIYYDTNGDVIEAPFIVPVSADYHSELRG